MNLKAFNKFRTHCPICQSKLVSIIDIDIITKRRFARTRHFNIDHLCTLQYVELAYDPLCYTKSICFTSVFPKGLLSIMYSRMPLITSLFVASVFLPAV